MDFYVVFPAKEACVADRLTSQTPDLEVRGSSFARRVVSFDKELYFNLPLFSQVYKWVQPCDGLATRPGAVAILLGMLHTKKSGISSGRLGLWLVCTFNFYLPSRKSSLLSLARLRVQDLGSLDLIPTAWSGLLTTNCFACCILEFLDL